MFGRPQLLAGAGEVHGDPLRLGSHAVERLAHPQILPEQLVPAAREHLLDDLVGLFAFRFGMLADELAHLLVRDFDPCAVGDGVERELARDRLPGLGAKALLQLLRRLVRDGEVGLGGDAPALERPGET